MLTTGKPRIVGSSLTVPLSEIASSVYLQCVVVEEAERLQEDESRFVAGDAEGVDPDSRTRAGRHESPEIVLTDQRMERVEQRSKMRSSSTFS
jgi:hypothetical protein